MTTTPARIPDDRPHHDVRNAWIAVAIFPLTVLAVMVVGDALLSAAGYESGDTDIPWTAKAFIGGPMVLLAIAPPLVGAWFGQRARRAGDRRGLAPVVVGLTLAGAFVAQNLVAVLLG